MRDDIRENKGSRKSKGAKGMKRLGLLSIIGCSVSGVAIAAGVDCNTIPTCAEMGFDKTVAECGESKVLRCPFDLTNDDAVYCAEGGGRCDELFTLDSCPTNGICAECGGKFILHSCERGYINGVDTCCDKSVYSLLQCPERGECSSCGDVVRLDSCSSGYTKADNVCCSDEYYNLDNKPDNSKTEQCGNKYHFIGCEEGYTEENGACVVEDTCKAVGDILYNDLECYDTAPSGKTAIGVVFDTTNKLAIGLTETSSAVRWWNSNVDVSGLENCSDSSTVRTTCGASGKTNSAALVAAGYTNASYAAGYCYNRTTGGLAKGDWFLPSIKELNTIYTNKSTISSAITSIGGTDISSSVYWSSAEYGSGYVWLLNMVDGDVHNLDKFGGINDVRCAVAY